MDGAGGMGVPPGRSGKVSNMKHVGRMTRPALASGDCALIVTLSLGTARIVFTSGAEKGDWIVNFTEAEESDLGIDVSPTC